MMKYFDELFNSYWCSGKKKQQKKKQKKTKNKKKTVIAKYWFYFCMENTGVSELVYFYYHISPNTQRF